MLTAQITTPIMTKPAIAKSKAFENSITFSMFNFIYSLIMALLVVVKCVGRLAREQLQVLWLVVRAVSVDVVDHFFFLQQPADLGLHDHVRAENVALAVGVGVLRPQDHDVAVLADDLSPTPTRMFLASQFVPLQALVPRFISFLKRAWVLAADRLHFLPKPLTLKGALPRAANSWNFLQPRGGDYHFLSTIYTRYFGAHIPSIAQIARVFNSPLPVKRARVHALSIYSTPLLLATTATGTAGTVPGVTVSAEQVTITSLLTSFLQSLDFSQVLILILVGSLFFREEIRAALKKYFGLNFNGNGAVSGSQPELKNMDQKMTQLQAHYNEETTHLLTELLHESRRHSAKLDMVIDHSRTIITKQDEMMKYGVPERKL